MAISANLFSSLRDNLPIYTILEDGRTALGGGGMGAGHHHGGVTAAPRRLRRVLAAVLIPLAFLTLLGLVLLWPHGVHRTFDSGSGTAKAVVTAVHPADCSTGPVPAAPGTPQCGTATVHLTSGPDRGQTLEVNLPEGYSAPSVRAGDRVVLSYPTHAAETPRPYAIIDHQRNRSLLLLGLLFCGQLKLISKRELRSLNSWMRNNPELASPTTNFLFVHPEDAARLGLCDGGAAWVRSLAWVSAWPRCCCSSCPPSPLASPRC